MFNYSHPKHYLYIAIIAIVVTTVCGLSIQRGFLLGIIGMGLFPFLYHMSTDAYLRTIRQVAIEFGLSLIALAFIPLGFILGIYSTYMPTTLDFLFFMIGFSSMVVVTNFLYILEPDTPQQSAGVVAFSTILLIIIILVVRIYTMGNYLKVIV